VAEEERERDKIHEGTRESGRQNNNEKTREKEGDTWGEEDFFLMP
jgi:hypothetical protein